MKGTNKWGSVRSACRHGKALFERVSEYVSTSECSSKGWLKQALAEPGFKRIASNWSLLVPPNASE